MRRRRKENHKRITEPAAKVEFLTTELSPYLCKILCKDILYDLRLYRSRAYDSNIYLRVVSQLSPKRIKETLEEKMIQCNLPLPYFCV